MSTVTDTTRSRVGDPLDPAHPSHEGGQRTRRRVSIIAAIGVLAVSIMEFVNLLSRHTAGPELYGVIVAVLAVAAGVLNLVLLRTGQRRLLPTAAVMILWSLVALGGLAGTVAHIVGPVPGHGAIDLRPRPIPAPLVFTLLGIAGCAAMWFGQRRDARPIHQLGEE